MEEDTVIYSGLIVIGGSAGSLEILMHVLSQLNPAFMIPIVVVMHRKATNDSSLTELLASRSRLPVTEPEEKEQILPGTVYICPADYHLLIEKDRTFSLDFSEKVNFSRPSIDVTFESAAEVYGATLIGILLSGANADGSKGMKKISENGGHTIVQQPSSAEVGFMPQQALNLIKPDSVLHGNEIGSYLRNLL